MMFDTRRPICTIAEEPAERSRKWREVRTPGGGSSTSSVEGPPRPVMAIGAVVTGLAGAAGGVAGSYAAAGRIYVDFRSGPSCLLEGNKVYVSLAALGRRGRATAGSGSFTGKDAGASVSGPLPTPSVLAAVGRVGVEGRLSVLFSSTFASSTRSPISGLPTLPSRTGDTGSSICLVYVAPPGVEGRLAPVSGLCRSNSK